jgi:thiol-disulfide isomerase/thioredoxin
VIQEQVRGKDQLGVDNLASVIQSSRGQTLQRFSFALAPKAATGPPKSPGLSTSTSGLLEQWQQQYQLQEANKVHYASQASAAAAFKQSGLLEQWLQQQLPSLQDIPDNCEVQPGQVITLRSAKDFHNCLDDSSGTVMVEFSEDRGCSPCRAFAPVYDRMAADYNGMARFLKISVYENEWTENLASSLQLQSVPRFYIFRSGKMVADFKNVGEEKLRSALDEYLR